MKLRIKEINNKLLDENFDRFITCTDRIFDASLEENVGVNVPKYIHLIKDVILEYFGSTHYMRALLTLLSSLGAIDIASFYAGYGDHIRSGPNADDIKAAKMIDIERDALNQTKLFSRLCMDTLKTYMAARQLAKQSTSNE